MKQKAFLSFLQDFHWNKYNQFFRKVDVRNIHNKVENIMEMSRLD